MNYKARARDPRLVCLKSQILERERETKANNSKRAYARLGEHATPGKRTDNYENKKKQGWSNSGKNTYDFIQLSPEGEVNSGGYIPRREASRYISTALHRP